MFHIGGKNESFRIFALAMVLVLVLTSVVSANHVPGFPLVGHTGSVSAVDSRAPDFTIQRLKLMVQFYLQALHYMLKEIQ